MSNHITFQEGQTLLYTGNGFDGFDPGQPYMTFLGYDSSSWTDFWVNYNGTKMRMRLSDVEKAESTGT